MLTLYIVYKSHLKPVGKGKLPDIIKSYVSEGLPHVTYTRDRDRAEAFLKEDAENLVFLLDAKMEEVGNN